MQEKKNEEAFSEGVQVHVYIYMFFLLSKLQSLILFLRFIHVCLHVHVYFVHNITGAAQSKAAG